MLGDYDNVVEKVDEITDGRMADIVLNSLGVKTWDRSFASVGVNGRLVTFGILTGADVKLNIQSLYSKQIKLIGATGGNRIELQEILTSFSAKDLIVKRRSSAFKMLEVLEALSAKEREGRILLEIKS